MDTAPGTRPQSRLSPLQRLAHAALGAVGWRIELAWPTAPRGVIIVYPHTSNWDFLLGILARGASGLPLSWVGKHTIFRWPLGPILRWLGGIPVDRRAPHGLIDQLRAELARRDWMWLALAPEGTRSRVEHWRSGFYHLALAAGVPLGLGYIDYGKREIGVAGYLTLTGDEAADMSRIRAAYQGKVARHPAQAGPIQLRE
jgi:1-acyl-sn-glycerol-3-phosphate acyltransferase